MPMSPLAELQTFICEAMQACGTDFVTIPKSKVSIAEMLRVGWVKAPRPEFGPFLLQYQPGTTVDGLVAFPCKFLSGLAAWLHWPCQLQALTFVDRQASVCQKTPLPRLFHHLRF